MRCQHCYADIREATITHADAEAFARDRHLDSIVTSAWLTESTRSPFCIRDLCISGVVHEIKHTPMPTV